MTSRFIFRYLPLILEEAKYQRKLPVAVLGAIYKNYNFLSFCYLVTRSTLSTYPHVGSNCSLKFEKIYYEN